MPGPAVRRGVRRLAKAEFQLAAVEDEVLGALDDNQREQLYNLLQQAANGGELSCSGAADEPDRLPAGED
ncbi:hypothetical protein Pth03_10890 [Planotetraspora thailandica]|uniref:MarR family transcriptional regulator n=1 Tax=Planotetraspora thailandica TaxID=487172 RepID=A0A8J3XU29_9ACTN|nr:hypothetical protein [Planotetraspora thailandica]GII52700.1 hypothetical protein Pth03_10890 [Planotetraspora thailandica]